MFRTKTDAHVDAVLSGENARVRHAFFTRKGGVSQGIYQSLNCSFGSSDRPGDVAANRAIVAAALQTSPERLVTVHQRHTARAVVAETPWRREDAPVADAIVTAQRGLAIAVLTADCAPVLFADPEAGVAGAAHAGWRGALAGVVEAAVEAMQRLGAHPSRIQATVGPTISQAAYEVGDDFRDAFLAADPEADRFFVRPDDGCGGEARLVNGQSEEPRPGGPAPVRPHFDLPGFLMSRLEKIGVQRRTNLGLCTCARESIFFSYRRSVQRNEPDYGRQISAILIL